MGIHLKETDEFIGWICSSICDDIREPKREIGYAISKYHRNKGYVTQATKGLIKYLFEKSNVKELTMIALTYNIPSNQVIQKCGFHYVDNVKIEEREFKHYLLSKKEWESILVSGVEKA